MRELPPAFSCQSDPTRAKWPPIGATQLIRREVYQKGGL